MTLRARCHLLLAVGCPANGLAAAQHKCGGRIWPRIQALQSTAPSVRWILEMPSRSGVRISAWRGTGCLTCVSNAVEMRRPFRGTKHLSAAVWHQQSDECGLAAE